MKNLTIADKDAIRNALSAYCDNYPTRNRASESLNGVSSATVSQIINSQVCQHLRRYVYQDRFADWFQL